MVGVYGDNWLRAASFSLMAIPLSSRAKEEEASVASVDAQLVAQRDELKAFKVMEGRMEEKRRADESVVRLAGCHIKSDRWSVSAPLFETE